MKNRLKPKNSCVFRCSTEKWISFNDKQVDNNGMTIEILHPILFRLVSLAVVIGMQIVPVVIFLTFGLFDHAYSDMLIILTQGIVILCIVLYIAFGGLIFRWVAAYKVLPERDGINNSAPDSCNSPYLKRTDA